MKKFFIIFINIIIFAGFFFLIDYGIYRHYAKIFYNDHPKSSPIQVFKYMPYHPPYMENLKGYFKGGNNTYEGRAPVGEEYTKPPIVIFGCSYAYGQYLEPNQTFSYKLSKLTQRPVYNRALPGAAFPLMYFQSTSDALYNEVKAPQDVIYVMIRHHWVRSLLYYFDVLDVFDMPHYKIKNNKLILDNYDGVFFNFIKSTYLAKHLNHIWAYNYVNNPKNKNKIVDMAVLYFIQSRKEMEKRWNKKINFTVVLYNDYNILYKDELTKKLKENGFNVINTDDLTKEDLKSDKYIMKENNHPSEKAWDLLIPHIINKGLL